MGAVISQLASIRARVHIIGCAALAVCQFTLFAPQAQASLDLDLADTPEIAIGWVSVDYDSTANELVVNEGYTGDINSALGVSDTIANPGFNLTAFIDEFGTLSGGTVTITGTVAKLGFNSGTLLTGDLTAYGAQAGAAGSPQDDPDLFEFLFTVKDGDAKLLYEAAGYAGAVLLSARTGFVGSFASDFDGLEYGSANVLAAVPEPVGAVVWSVLGACVAVVWWRRCRGCAT